MKKKITIPLPPSVNTLYLFNPRTHQKIYKQSVRDYYEVNTLQLRAWAKRHFVSPVSEMAYFDLDFYLGSKNADAHNYLKVVCDLFQKADLVENDKYMMNRIQSIQYDKENPRVEITWLAP